MAVELCTDNSSRGISPRISFSHDLNNSDIVPIEPHIPLKSSLHDYDFDFCINRRSSYDQESSLADELFENGIILPNPIQIKRKNLPSKSKSLLPPLPPSSVTNSAETENSRETEGKQGRSFWKFKRSKSLNCGSIYRRGFCSFPLLSRSKSTGSTASNAKGSLISKDEAHNYSHNHHNIGGFKQSSQKNLYSSHNQRPPLKRNYGSSFNSGVVQVSPVLNVPIAKLLGFGAIFYNAKDKGRKK